MTCVEFAKMFDVFITFNRDGEGQIFGKGTHPPKLMEKEDFWVPTIGGDSMLLPCLVDDYDYYSSKHKAILISPDSKEPDKETEQTQMAAQPKEKKVECHDFDKVKEVEVNVEVIDICSYPDTTHLKLDETINNITLFDGKHHFNYKSKSKEIPEKGKKYFLKATVKKQIDQIEVEIPCFEIGSVKLLKEKKKK